MKNYVQPGNNLTVAAPYAVDSGQGVLFGQIFGVAAGDADNGAEVDISTVGVFDLAKTSAAVFTVGAPVYFDTATKSACRKSSLSYSATPASAAARET